MSHSCMRTISTVDPPAFSLPSSSSSTLCRVGPPLLNVSASDFGGSKKGTCETTVMQIQWRAEASSSAEWAATAGHRQWRNWVPLPL